MARRRCPSMASVRRHHHSRLDDYLTRYGPDTSQHHDDDTRLDD